MLNHKTERNDLLAIVNIYSFLKNMNNIEGFNLESQIEMVHSDFEIALQNEPILKYLKNLSEYDIVKLYDSSLVFNKTLSEIIVERIKEGKYHVKRKTSNI